MKFEHEDLGLLEFRRPTWDDFALWWDSVDHSGGTANTNLVAACAVSPDAAALTAKIEEHELGFLPQVIAGELLKACSGNKPFEAEWPIITAPERQAEIKALASGKTKRPLAVDTPAGLWVMRPPSTDAACAFIDGSTNARAGRKGASYAEAARALVLACVVSPDTAAVAAAIQEYPDIVRSLHGHLSANLGKGLRAI